MPDEQERSVRHSHEQPARPHEAAQYLDQSQQSPYQSHDPVDSSELYQSDGSLGNRTVKRRPVSQTASPQQPQTASRSSGTYLNYRNLSGQIWSGDQQSTPTASVATPDQQRHREGPQTARHATHQYPSDAPQRPEPDPYGAGSGADGHRYYAQQQERRQDAPQEARQHPSITQRQAGSNTPNTTPAANMSPQFAQPRQDQQDAPNAPQLSSSTTQRRDEYEQADRAPLANGGPRDAQQVGGMPAPSEHEQHHGHEQQILHEKQLGGIADTQSPTEPVRAPTEEELKKGPAGGYDATPIPHRTPGYTMKFTIHKAKNLPISDLATMSADPYCRLELKTGLPTRHKEDPPLMFRTRTIWRETEPVWEQSWIVANVPATGARLKVRVYDEDSNDTDDRLGNSHITISGLHDNWEGIEYKSYKINKRAGSWRAYALRAVAVCLKRTAGMHGELYVSAQCLGRTPGDEGGRAYTIGLQYWCKNYSPMLGRLAGSKEPNDPEYNKQHNEDHDRMTGEDTSSVKEKSKEKAPSVLNSNKKSQDQHNQQRYNFQSNQMQLQGPVPPELYHRYVEFRPFVKSMFTGSGLRGLILNKAIHAQHTKVYNFNKDTRYGVFEDPCNDMTLKFLDLAHFDQGGRIHTYIITLDGLMRFTETGKEFSIDLLSKHTMHSDGSIYIAFSGEFFIRRLKNKSAPAPLSHDAQKGDPSAQENETHPPKKLPGGPPGDSPPHDPADYELVIDNDSGTYRPNAKLLPLLRRFLEQNFRGLKIVTLDCQADEELMKKLKEEQRERKKKEGDQLVFTQVSRSSSTSSSDEERLDELASSQQDDAPAQRRHRLGEAIGPFVNEHEHARKLVMR